MGSRLLSTGAEEIFPRNVSRRSFIIANEDSVIPLYIKRERVETPTVSATVHDYKIGPGGLISLNSSLDGLQSIQDRWTIVADSGTPRVGFFETEDVAR